MKTIRNKRSETKFGARGGKKERKCLNRDLQLRQENLRSPKREKNKSDFQSLLTSYEIEFGECKQIIFGFCLKMSFIFVIFLVAFN